MTKIATIAGPERVGCKRPGALESGFTPASARDARDAQAYDRWLHCVACGQRITTRASGIEMDGRHRHHRANPHGVTFEFGCFQAAPGVNVSGEATDEYSWFSGYAWQIALCGACQTHLGWFFSGPSPFFGLLLNRLAEAQ